MSSFRALILVGFGLAGLTLALSDPACAQDGNAFPGAGVAAQPPHIPEGGASAPAAEVEGAYFKVVASAITEFDAHHFGEARALFAQAHALWPSARTWRTLGMTAFELQLYPQAQAELSAALDDPRRPLDTQQRAQVQALLEQTRGFVGSYRIHLSPAAAKLSVDGLSVTLGTDGMLLLGVGHHELRASAPGHRELRISVVVEGGEDQGRDLSLQSIAAPVPPPLHPPHAASPAPITAQDGSSSGRVLRASAWTASGVAAGGLLLGIVAGELARRQKGELVGACPDRMCTPPYWEDIRTLQRESNFATAGYVLAGAGALAAGVLWWGAHFARARDRPERKQTVRLSPLGVHGHF